MECCGHTFVKTFTYNRHLNSDKHRKATGQSLERKFVCDTCNTGFTRDDDRQRHVFGGHCAAGRAGSSISIIPEERKHGFPQVKASTTVAHENTHDYVYDRIQTGTSPDHADGLSDGLAPFSLQRTFSGRSFKLNDSGSSRYSVTMGADQYETLPRSIEASTEQKFCDGDFIMNDLAETTDHYSTWWGGIDITDDAQSTDHGPLSLVNTRKMAFPLLERLLATTLPDSEPNPSMLNVLLEKCVTCKKPFERDQKKARQHLDEHIKALQLQYRCDECLISFERPQDLRLHQQRAASGFCGFNFMHRENCSGHHPPDLGIHAERSDHDRLKIAILNWHYAQSRVSTANATAVLQEMSLKPSTTLSARSLPKRSTIGSVSVRSFRSTPYDLETNSAMKMEAIEESIGTLKIAESPPWGSTLFNLRHKAHQLCGNIYAEVLADPHAERVAQNFGMSSNQVVNRIENCYPKDLQIEEQVSMADRTLVLAAACGRTDLVKSLLQLGDFVDVNAVDGNRGFTPLHYALHYGHLEVAIHLIKAGAATMHRDFEGKVAYNYTSSEELPKLVRLFVDDKTIPYHSIHLRGECLWVEAAEENRPRIADVLFGAGLTTAL